MQKSSPEASLKVFGDGPLERPLQAIASAFGSQTGCAVQVSVAASPLIARRILEGEPGDVVVVQPEHIVQIASAGKACGGPLAVIAKIGVGLAARTATHVAPISTPEALKAAILGADGVLCNELASGNHFMRVLEQLGIADSVQAKIIRTGPAKMLGRVRDDEGNLIAACLLTQIHAFDGVKLIGPLPEELQTYLEYTAAMLTNTLQPNLARDFIACLGTVQAKAAFRAAGGC